MSDRPRVILSAFADEAANHKSALEQLSVMAAVGRLEQSWRKVKNRAVVAELDELMAMTRSFAAYRAALAALDASTPRIPYLGVVLSDHTYIDNMPTYKAGLINWAKLELLGGHIAAMIEAQAVPFTFVSDPNLAAVLDLYSHASLTHRQLHAMSIAREPPAGNAAAPDQDDRPLLRTPERRPGLPRT